MNEVQRIRATMQALAQLRGKWCGSGRGEFPGMPPFEYEDELSIKGDDFEAVLQFEQRTWQKDQHGKLGAPRYWETGFLRALAHGVEMTLAHNGARVEVLRGELDPTALRKGAVQISLTSTLVGNDESVLQTRREFHVSGDRLKYKVAMATPKAPALHPYLEAELARVGWFEQLR
ncbi:FABP family protein [candidate division KSB1 bacterium]|nr:FABP family protein [candidate division KSB1 bacterium]